MPMVAMALNRVCRERLVAQNLRDAVAGLAVEILPNGIDPSQWRRSASVQRQPTDKIVTVTAMRLHGRKRPMALLRAFRIARELSSTGNRRLMLYVAGDGSERARLNIMSIATGLDVTSYFWAPYRGRR